MDRAKQLTFISRRAFLSILKGLPLTVLLPSCLPKSSPSSPGLSCLEPLTEQEATLQALADTVVPGGASDPTGAPGAPEACALSGMYDKLYPFSDYAPVIITLLDTLARQKYGPPFRLLGLDKRTTVLSEAEAALPILTLALRFIRADFYAAAINRVGWDYTGYPGENLGYRSTKGFSLGEKISEELTPDGNMP